MSSAWYWLMDGGDSWQHNVLLSLIRITAILAGTWLCHSAWSRWNPRLRILLWRTAAIGLIVAMALSQLPYRLNLPILPPAANLDPAMDSGHAPGMRNTAMEIRGAVPVPISRSPPVEAALLEPSWTQSSESPRGREATSAPVVELDSRDQSATFHSRRSAAREASRRQLSLLGCAVAAWSSGVAFMLLTWLIGMFRLLSLSRRASTVSAKIQTQANAIAATFGYSGPIDIRHSSEILSPCNVGAWRLRILIPRMNR